MSLGRFDSHSAGVSESLGIPESLHNSKRPGDDGRPVFLSLAVNQADQPDGSGQSPARGLAGLIAANLSLIVAIMIYMGWAYENAFYGYFHLNPLELGVGTQDYLLFSLNLFKPFIVVAAVVAVLIAVAGTKVASSLAKVAILMVGKFARFVRTAPRLKWLNRMIPPGIRGKLWKLPRVLMCLGIATTAIGLLLYAIADYVPVSTYLVLGLLALGPLLLTWTLRATRQGRVLYALAVAVLIVCALWAGSLYANSRGTGAAEAFTSNIDAKTAVLVYSVQPLALSGNYVSVHKLPAGLEYRYRYEGLRLLYMNSSTYYLLPVGWIPQLPQIYILNSGDQIRIEFY
jgi:hypothetical protein